MIFSAKTFVTTAIITASAASLTPATASALAHPAEEPATAAVITPPRRHRPSPIPTATQLASTSLPAVAAAACAYPTVTFSGAAYCPGTIVGVRGTAYGIGTRVVLKGVTVTTVTPSAVTVAAWTSPPCPPGKYCGAILTLESLSVPWSGTSRPAYGDVLNLFLTTTRTSGQPVGYLKTGYCPIDWC